MYHMLKHCILSSDADMVGDVNIADLYGDDVLAASATNCSTFI